MPYARSRLRSNPEHGPHVKLENDWLPAESFEHEVRRRAEVVIAPPVNYRYYPAFIEYPGSITLRLQTARGMMVDS